MGHRFSPLGNTLRAIVLSTPFAQAMALPACSQEVGNPPCSDAGRVVALPSGYRYDGGSLQCQGLCPKGFFCSADSCPLCSDDGVLSVQCGYPPCIGGRRPSGLRSTPKVSGSRPVAQFWRQMSHLEAASVIAFDVLRRELRAHGAPRGLIDRARRAAADEVRHARITAQLCRANGGRCARASVSAPKRVRALDAVARENSVEGCVRETYGALVSLWQARHAGDARTRHAMRLIAVDEVSHADLAWSVASWAEPRLGGSARRRIDAARRRALAELVESTEQPIPAECVTVAGLPHPVVARKLAERMGAMLSLG